MHLIVKRLLSVEIYAFRLSLIRRSGYYFYYCLFLCHKGYIYIFFGKNLRDLLVHSNLATPAPFPTATNTGNTKCSNKRFKCC